MIELTEETMKQWDVLSEYEPPELLGLIENYSSQDFTPRDWRRVSYFRGKALATMSYFRDSEEIAIECIRESIAEADYYILVKSHVLQAVSYYGSEKEDQIRPLLNMAIDYSLESGNYELMIHAHCAYMFYFNHNSQFDSALKQELRIVDLIKRIQPSYTSASALSSLAFLYVNMSKWDIAINYFNQALSIAKELALDIYILNILNNLGTALSKIKDYSTCEQILQQGLEMAKQMGHMQKVFLFTSNLGNLMIEKNEFEKALSFYDKCMAILENVAQKPPMLVIDIYNNYALCHWKLKDDSMALDYMNKAIELARANNFERYLIQIEV